jgi:hypothetical protein
LEGAIVLQNAHPALIFTMSSRIFGQYTHDVALAYMEVTAE